MSDGEKGFQYIYIYIYITINFGTRLKLLLRVSRLMRSSDMLSDDRIKHKTLSNNLSLVPKFIVIASSI